MAYKYDVINLITADSQIGEVPATLKDKVFSSFTKVADAICTATEATKPQSVTVRRLEDGRLMGYRSVMPAGNGDYYYQRHWAPEY